MRRTFQAMKREDASTSNSMQYMYIYICIYIYIYILCVLWDLRMAPSAKILRMRLKRELQISSKFAMRNFSNIRHRSFE